MSAFGLREQVPARNEIALRDRPEERNAGRRKRVGGQPVEQQVRAVRNGADESDLPPRLPAEARRAKTGDPACHGCRNNEDHQEDGDQPEKPARK